MAAPLSRVYRFGEFRLDPAHRRLQRGGEDVVLPLKVFNCLVYLVENRDRAVGRDELIEHVWGTVNMTDNTLAQAIAQARHALGDSGEVQMYIETVRGFGYRWTSAVQINEPRALWNHGDPTSTTATPRRRRTRLWLAIALLALGALATAAIYLRRGPAQSNSRSGTSYTADGGIALLLPVTVEARERHAWIPLGLMELIAERLRTAGQPMVPSETVLAVARPLSPEPTPVEIDEMAASTGVRLVLVAHAQALRSGTWRVSLRSLHGSRPPLSVLGEADDVLDAARLAADHMALSLGLTPAAEAETEIEAGLDLLLRQIDAAILAQQRQVALELIATASPELRAHPEVRLQSANLDFYTNRLQSARTTLEALLVDAEVELDAGLRARVLNRLGTVHWALGDTGEGPRLVADAAKILTREDHFHLVGPIHNNLGMMALARGDLVAARAHMARARGPLESSRDLVSLAVQDANLGILHTLRGHYGEALSHFEYAALRLATLNNIGYELQARASALLAHLYLLDFDAAVAAEPRLIELLAQTDNTDITTYANLARVHLLNAMGSLDAADALFAEVLSSEQTNDPLQYQWLDAQTLRAQRAAHAGDLDAAARLATEIVRLAPRQQAMRSARLGAAWLILVRSELGRGRLTAAAEATAALEDWAGPAMAPAARIYAYLARGEVAALTGRVQAAQAAFDDALALADSLNAPLLLLEVAQAYTAWLLTETPDRRPDLSRASVVAGRVAPYAESCYEAALLQVSLYRVTGPASAWRAALLRAGALAGERVIPPELEAPPQS